MYVHNAALVPWVFSDGEKKVCFFGAEFECAKIKKKLIRRVIVLILHWCHSSPYKPSPRGLTLFSFSSNNKISVERITLFVA